MYPIARLLPAALFLLAAPFARADGGRVTGHTGDSFIERGSSVRGIDSSSIIYSGDTLRTNDNGRVQWTMMDDSSFAMLGDSKFKVDEFSTTGKAKAIFSLLKGGFRTITGLISKRAGDEYRVETPVATLGVRGTIYTAIFCKGGCDKYIADATERAKVQDGLYVKVEQGTVTIKNSKGSIEVHQGEVGFVPNDGSAPVIADASAAAFMNSARFNAELPLPSITLSPPTFSVPDPTISIRVQPSDTPPAPPNPPNPPVCPSSDPRCPPPPPVCPSSDPRCPPPVCPSSDPRCPPPVCPGDPSCPPPVCPGDPSCPGSPS